MKVFTITKKGLVSIFLCFLIGAIALTVVTSTASQVAETSSAERIIPIYYVDTDEKVCSISFDAAWGNEQTDTLLQILDEHKVKTTFFLVGEWVDKFPESVKEIDKRGHDVGNHSDTHAHMTQISLDEQANELKNCNEKITKITGKKVTLFRPPYGEYDNSVVTSSNDCGMHCVQWNIDSLDWKDPTPDDMVQRIEQNLCPGSIILLHNGAKNTPEALPLIIEAIKAQGYEIIPISEIIPKGEYYTDHEGKMILKDKKNNT
ncbi:MAG: polysaccharide deacetylase family protein [Ruminococcaceae bacterium]|nr:polysaccharide deacetylase family protein [Oscillospiraceae bacterium]